MGFLDNSGDIILDAVLTDLGRDRLAKGDGSFKIAKYGFADDEINYSQYRNSNHSLGAHPSGSAYYDLDILQTPILEAFTNNASSMKSMLLSIPQTNLLYLPLIKLNEKQATTSRNTVAAQANGFFAVGVDADTVKDQNATSAGMGQAGSFGLINGVTPGAGGTHIRLDQGLDTVDISPAATLDPDLKETLYIIEIDNRLGKICSANGSVNLSESFLDDDNIATYYVSMADTGFVTNNTNQDEVTAGGKETIQGPRGTILRFNIKSSILLQTSNELFKKIGVESATWTTGNSTSITYNYIDSIVRVMGATTGYKVDIPVKFVKKA